MDKSKALDKTKITFLQRAVGKLLYHARAVDPTMLHAINDMSLSASEGTEATLEATTHSLNCAHADPDAEVMCRGSDLTLRVDSDAAHLVAPEAKSRAGGYHCLSSEDGALFNGPIIVLAKDNSAY